MKRTIQRWTWLECLLLIVAGAWPAHAFYNPTTGRWLSRDPIEERGGQNLYTFVLNAPACNIDFNGLQTTPPPSPPPPSAPPSTPPPNPCPMLECQWPSGGDAASEIPDGAFDSVPGAATVIKKAACALAGKTCREACSRKYGKYCDLDDPDTKPNRPCYKACIADCEEHLKRCNGDTKAKPLCGK